jgi:hypothetical protein
MLLYFAEDVTARCRGQIWRWEECEHCGNEFYYVAEVVGEGTAHNPLGWDTFGSREKAISRAMEDLNRRLATQVVPAPCPHCLRFQSEMLPVVRRKQYRWMLSLALVLLVFAGPGFCVGTFMGTIRPRGQESGPDPLEMALIPPVCFLAAGTTVILLRVRRQTRYDPNAEEHQTERRLLAQWVSLKPDEFARIHPQLLPSTNDLDNERGRSP